MSDAQRTYLYSKDSPEGRIFDLTEEQAAEMLADGWVDSPALIHAQPETTAPTAEEIEAIKVRFVAGEEIENSELKALATALSIEFKANEAIKSIADKVTEILTKPAE